MRFALLTWLEKADQRGCGANLARHRAGLTPLPICFACAATGDDYFCSTAAPPGSERRPLDLEFHIQAHAPGERGIGLYADTIEASARRVQISDRDIGDIGRGLVAIVADVPHPSGNGVFPIG